ncbi:hypothetical protein DMUE_4537, partial [Dictyocoela muelleri]
KKVFSYEEINQTLSDYLPLENIPDYEEMTIDLFIDEIKNENDFLEFSSSFCDIFDESVDMKSNRIPDDKNIEHVDFYKDIVYISNENEPEVVSIDEAFICFDKLKSYLLNNKRLDHDVYDSLKCI